MLAAPIISIVVSVPAHSVMRRIMVTPPAFAVGFLRLRAREDACLGVTSNVEVGYSVGKVDAVHLAIAV
jgi:hypothetical protein